MAKEAWAPSRKKGEADGAYKKRYYSAQRDHAEETGDQATTDKIYGKLGKKSHSVDADAVNKKALAYGPALAAGGAVGLGRLGAGAAARAALGTGGAKAIGSGMKMATKVAPKAAAQSMRKLPGQVPRLASNAGQKALSTGGRTPVRAQAAEQSRALSSQRALPKPKNAPPSKPSSDKPRTYNSTGAGSSRTSSIKTTGRNMARTKRSGASENSNTKYGKSKPKAKKGGR